LLCMLGSHHVHKDKIRKIHKMFMLESRSWECRPGAVFTFYLHVFYLFYPCEHDGIPTCIVFTDSRVKRPEDDLYIGRNMQPVIKHNK
jgi:hypothetical protein